MSTYLNPEDDIYVIALARARREFPLIQAEVAAMYSTRKWHYYFRRYCDPVSDHALARAVCWADLVGREAA